MSKWIDADALMKRVEDSNKSAGLHLEDLRKIRRWINTAPSIDIVRCKECKYWEESQYYQGFMVCTYVTGATFTRQHDDFCSRGERKESE